MDTVEYEKLTNNSREGLRITCIVLGLVYGASMLWMFWTIQFMAGQILHHRDVSSTLWELSIDSTVCTVILTLFWYPLMARWDDGSSEEPKFEAVDGVFFAAVCCVPLLILVVAYYLL